MSTLTPADLEVWRGYGRYDQAIGALMEPLERKAIQEIRKFHELHPDCITNVSWGKDSVVVAHLTWMADPAIPIIWVPAVREDGTCYETEPSFQVRDAFLRAHPGCVYAERPGLPRNPRRGEPGWEDYMRHVKERHQDMLGEQIHDPHITGVRADESAMRRMSIRSRGLSSTKTCRPIGRWSAEQVFAYLAARDLPVHGAYAASYGGHLDRRWLRVHAIRSAISTSATHYHDIAQWEDDYFPTLCDYQPREESV
ncbi:phosphoadenosine phosphosulfate reductase family protein [Bifidobacterium actinocoloniiforme]|nr:phosphoadenosine phosphosulfate reductase family protein [Bifidobacterium actinocoloniiforme]